MIGDALRRLPIPPVRIQVNNRKLCQGFYRGLGIDRHRGGAARGRQARQDRPGRASPSCWSETAGATEAQAKACLALAEISAEDASFADAVRALGVNDPLLDEGLEELVRVVETARRAPARACCVADLKIARGLDYYTGTVYETQHARVRAVRLDLLRRAVRQPGRRRAPTASRAWASRSACPGCSALLFGAGALTVSRSVPTCVLVALPAEEQRPDSRPDRRGAAPARHRDRGVAVGGQVRQADPVRRAARHPVRLVPGGDGPDEVKDIRSGDQVEADPAQWTPPDEDLHPVIGSA